MNILITGKESYIGEHIRSHLESSGYDVCVVDTVSDDWKQVDYSQFQCVVHVAANVHQNAKDASEDLFVRVNSDLPVYIAELAKQNGVKQYILLSTMGVYGKTKSLSFEESVIDSHTVPCAVGGYGGSKLNAERRLSELQDEYFHLAFVRPPNVYGPGCRGNYISLFKKLALMLLICPCAYTEIRQSMLYIDNLSELIRLIIKNESDGVFLPQDEIAPNTVELVSMIRDIYGRKTINSKLLGQLVKSFSSTNLVKKIFGSIQYDYQSSNAFDYQYQIVSFEEGINRTYT